MRRLGRVIFSMLGVLWITGPALVQAEEPPSGSEHIFPLMKSLIKDRPDLPPPYGVSWVSNWIDTDWQFKSATVGINDPNVPVGFAENCTGSITAATTGIKLDTWVLPFLDVFATGGYVHDDAELILRNVPVKFIPPSVAPPQPAQIVRSDAVVDFTLDGSYYTLGMVLAGGYKKFFSSADFSATKTDFGHKEVVHGDQSWTYSVAPRVGYAVGLSQFWVGGRYMNYSTHYSGIIPIPSGQNLAFDVDLKTASWNMTGGFRTVIKEHWEVLLESGFGARHMMTGSVGYRW